MSSVLQGRSSLKVGPDVPQQTYPMASCLNSERYTKMTKSTRSRYTLEFKQEAVRFVESGQSQAVAARSPGVVEQTLDNWGKEHRAGTLKAPAASLK